MTTPAHEIFKDKAPETGKEFAPEMLARFKEWTTKLVANLALKEQRVSQTPKPDADSAERERFEVAQDNIGRRLAAAREIQMALV